MAARRKIDSCSDGTRQAQREQLLGDETGCSHGPAAGRTETTHELGWIRRVFFELDRGRQAARIRKTDAPLYRLSNRPRGGRDAHRKHEALYLDEQRGLSGGLDVR